MPSGAKRVARPCGLPCKKKDEYEPAEAGSLDTTRAHDARHTLTLMEGIKEKMFQIEVERKQGQISRAECEKAKAALDQTLARAKARGTTSLSIANSSAPQ